MKSKVYFSSTITSEKVLEMVKMLNKELPGNVAIKVHSGEVGNQNFLRPAFWKDVVEYIGGTIVECNTLYDGERSNFEKHMKTMKFHGWSELFKVDVMDGQEPDMVLEVPNGKVIKQNYVGAHLKNYDSMIVLSHFKGHPMGGFGGAIKQLSIGISSAYGKAVIHGAGDAAKGFKGDHDLFLDAMAEAAGSVVEYFKGNVIYVNVMKNMSVDCDCCAVAEDPCMKDIGVLVSLDPIAIDQACVDKVYASDDPGRDHLVERIESRNGLRTIESAAAQGYGSREYELVVVD